MLAQHKNKEKNNDISSYFEILNPVKLIKKVFMPSYRKIQFTEYMLNAPFKNICELRTYESFSLRSIKTKNETELFNSAEFVFYWSQDIVVNYHLEEDIVEKEHGVGSQKLTKITIFVISTDAIIKKFNDDRTLTMRYAAAIKKRRSKDLQPVYHNSFERITKFIKCMFATDRIIENFQELIQAFSHERCLQKYFYENDKTFVESQKV
jgi:hypothetical protein